MKFLSIHGEKIGALCITEPFGGSDVGGMRTAAVLDGDHYLINGSKTFITNGVYSDYLIVAAKTKAPSAVDTKQEELDKAVPINPGAGAGELPEDTGVLEIDFGDEPDGEEVSPTQPPDESSEDGGLLDAPAEESGE